MEATHKEEWAREAVADLKRHLAEKISVALEAGDLKRAETLSKILGNLLDKSAE